MNLRKTARLIAQFYDHELQFSELRITQFGLLTSIQRLGPVSITELADHMGMERTTLTRNVKILERDGYAEMHPGEDARTRIVTITKTGLSAVKNTMPFWEAAQAKFMKSFGSKRWQRLRQELGDVEGVIGMSATL